MLYIISIVHAVFDPKGLFGPLAFGAMAIAAAIVTDMFPSTMVALIFVA
jgi:hypothetical protein